MAKKNQKEMDYESLLGVKKALQGWAELVMRGEARDSKQKQGTKVQTAQKETMKFHVTILAGLALPCYKIHFQAAWVRYSETLSYEPLKVYTRIIILTIKYTLAKKEELWLLS